jgi:all-trans-8'-apo-beta-carotenal 15,15'-oxygenase
VRRRQLLKRSLAAAGLLAAQRLPASTRATAGAEPLGWHSILSDELPALAMDVEGDVPDVLRGTLLRNGPARYRRGERRYDHWFDGDGMLQQFHIDAGAIVHRGRFIATERYRKESAAGRFLYDGAGTDFADLPPGRNNDSINVANTALLPWEDDVLALWEGGSAYRVDPSSLATRGTVTWGEGLEHMPFSAHPLVEADGSAWNFGFAPYTGGGGSLIVYRIAPRRGLLDLQLIPLPFGGYMHDFAMTGQHLVFLLPAYHYQRDAGTTFVERFVWEPERGSRLLVIDKDDLDRRQWFELPAGFVFHFGHAATRGSSLHLTLCWYDTPDIMGQRMRAMLRDGSARERLDARAAVVTADLGRGRAGLQISDTALEFPGFYGAVPGPDAPLFGLGARRDGHGQRDTLCAFDAAAGLLDEFAHDRGVLAEEPLPVRARDGSRWLLQTTLDTRDAKTRLLIFDADAIGDGPRARAAMDRALPLGFHGTFLPAPPGALSEALSGV